MIKINKIFISLTPIGYGGAGDYLHEINKDYLDYTKVITPSIFLKYKFINRIFIKLFSLILKVYLKIIVKFIKIENLVIFHQQSIGYDLVSRFIFKSKNIKLFILDTNFFCKKSYNEYNNNPCFSCYSSFNPYNDCYHHPNSKATDKDYLKFLKSLSDNIKNIEFIVQTEGYKKLIKEKFNNYKIEIKKMYHEKLISENFSYKDEINNFKYDFFYHAHITPPKGINYYYELANQMPEKNFFLPSNFDYKKISKNISYKKINWSKEFIDIMKTSKIIICPSVWTYPVESAVIKSLLLKKGVAIISNHHSFSDTIPRNCIIKLTGNIKEDIIILSNILRDNKYIDYGKNGYDWVIKYLKN